MEENVDTLEVTASAEESITADRVDVHLTLEGSSLFTGHAALKQARELRDLMERLEARAIPSSAVQLEGMEARISSKLLGKSSSALYRLRIELTDPAQLADVLQILVSLKQVELQSLDWRYSNLHAVEQRLLSQCVALGKEKARQAAQALGCELGAPHRVVELAFSVRPEERERGVLPMVGVYATAMRRRGEELDLEATHSQRVSRSARLVFHLARAHSEAPVAPR
jgi:uncharacterized protein YggE